MLPCSTQKVIGSCGAVLCFGWDRSLSLLFVVGRKKRQVNFLECFFSSNFDHRSTFLGHGFLEEPDRNGQDVSGSKQAFDGIDIRHH